MAIDFDGLEPPQGKRRHQLNNDMETTVPTTLRDGIYCRRAVNDLHTPTMKFPLLIYIIFQGLYSGL